MAGGLGAVKRAFCRPGKGGFSIKPIAASVHQRRRTKRRQGTHGFAGGAAGEAQDSGASPGSEQTAAERLEEDRKLRRLQLMMNVVMSVIAQDRSLTVDDAAQMIADTRTAALAMFPDKAEAFDLLYRPRLQRLMRERFRIQ